MLEGKTVRDVMDSDPVTVERSLSLRDFVNDYVYRYRSRLFPVVEGTRLAGCASVDRLREIPREHWHDRAVAEIVSSCSEDNTVDPSQDLTELASGLGQAAFHRIDPCNAVGFRRRRSSGHRFHWRR